MLILKGYITQTKDGGRFAKVITFQEEVIDDVLLLYSYGEASFMESDDSSLVLLFCPLGNKSNVFGIPYNFLSQPILEATEKAVGNFKKGNKITFKKNGDIIIDGANDLLAKTLVNAVINATNKITLNAPSIDLGSATDFVLNKTASMQVVIPSGSSAGTYQVQIVNAGQSKVKA